MGIDTQTIARIVILAVFLAFIWWFIIRSVPKNWAPERFAHTTAQECSSVLLGVRPKKKMPYYFKGLQKYTVDTSLVEEAIPFFNQLYYNHKKPKSPRSYDKTEKMCRKILEKHFNAKFPSVRPDWLKSPVTKKNLELDCYNSDLGIALEYNGKQHYTYTPHFHKSKKDFYSQVHRDDWKRKRCKEIGIKLIEVPYWVGEIDLENYILKRVCA